jgi:hypothetical protein
VAAAGPPVTIVTFPMVALILVCIDLAAAVGAVDYFASGHSAKVAA